MRRKILVHVIFGLQFITGLNHDSTIEYLNMSTSSSSITKQKITNKQYLKFFYSSNLHVTKQPNYTSYRSLTKRSKKSLKRSKKETYFGRKNTKDTSIPRIDKGIPNTFYNLTANVDGQDIVFRVLNGKSARLGTIPHQVGFFSKFRNTYTSFCGGTLVSRTKIISAAHCFVKHTLRKQTKGFLSKDNLKSMYAVMAIEKSTSGPTFVGHAQWRLLQSGRYPQNFKFPNVADICIVYTAKPFQLTSYVSTLPYCVLPGRRNYEGMACTISGFGRISWHQHSTELLYAEVEVLSDKACAAIHKRNMFDFLCTSDLIGDVYKGDSGGPLECDGELAGVVSGKLLGRISGSFFTRVDSYKTFLNRSVITKPLSHILILVSTIKYLTITFFSCFSFLVFSSIY